MRSYETYDLDIDTRVPNDVCSLLFLCLVKADPFYIPSVKASYAL